MAGWTTWARGWLPAVAIAGVLVPQAGPAAAGPRPERSGVAVLAGGCYWGVESVFRHVRGIQEVVSGYAVPAGSRERAEAVRLRYDPSRISYHTILAIFFSVVNDPTQRNRQGPDVGQEYRSIVFPGDAQQGALARAYIDSLSRAKVFPVPS